MNHLDTEGELSKRVEGGHHRRRGRYVADRRRLLFVAGAPVLAIGWSRPAGTTQETNPSTPAGPAGTAGPIAGTESVENGTTSVAFLNPYPADTFWQVVQSAVENAALAAGMAIEVMALDVPSAPDQVAQFEAAVTAGHDGIIVGVIDPAGSVPGIVAANLAAVPVVAINSQPAGGEIVSLITTDEEAAARSAGEFVAEAIDGVGLVLNLQGDMANQVARDRDRGFREALAAYPDIEIVSRSANWVEQEAFVITADLVSELPSGTPEGLEATPAVANAEPTAIFGANDLATSGALAAIAAAGREEIAVVGFGSVLEGAGAVASGQLAAVVAPFPARLGTIAVEALERHLAGEMVPAEIDAGFILITEENADRFLPMGTPVGP